MSDAKRGDWVQVHKIFLEPGQRADNLPACTQAVPYEGWIKGFLLNEEANIGDEVKVESFIGRKISGILHRVNPTYDHNFGAPQKEILYVGNASKKVLEQLREDEEKK